MVMGLRIGALFLVTTGLGLGEAATDGLAEIPTASTVMSMAIRIARTVLPSQLLDFFTK